jgi:hypothetical protein
VDRHSTLAFELSEDLEEYQSRIRKVLSHRETLGYQTLVVGHGALVRSTLIDQHVRGVSSAGAGRGKPTAIT